jgi:hypothetical protein
MPRFAMTYVVAWADAGRHMVKELVDKAVI